MTRPARRERVLRFGVFEADLRTGELRKHGVRVRIHGRPFELLAALLERPGELVTRDELRARLWEDGTFVDFDHALNNAVNRVRAALGDPASRPRFVETLPRRGYRFIAPVEEVALMPAGIPGPPAASPRAHRRTPGVVALTTAASVLLLAAASLALLRLTDAARPASTASQQSPAYDAYLKGRYHQNKPDPASWHRAREFFADAIALDSPFAPAHGALASTWNSLGRAGALLPDEAHARAHAAAEEALRLDPGLAEAHVALGTAKLMMNWDWPSAERAYRRAITLDPDLPEARQNYALLLAAMGRWPESLREIERARHLDPLDVSIHADAGRVLYLARRYDEAIVQLRSTLELEPRDPFALKLLSDAYLRKDMRAEAAAAFSRFLESVGVGDADRVVAARLLGEGGFPRLARRNLANPGGKALDAFGVPFKVALNHAAIGHHDQALDWLERAYRQRDPRLVYLKVDPDFDPLRGAYRFQRLLRDAGL